MYADKKDVPVEARSESVTTPSNAAAPVSHAKKPVHISIDDQQIIDLATQLRELKSDQIDEILPLAKWSLESVTHLTEYEDEKANRILTAVAFLSALVSVAFAAIVQRYPFSVAGEVKGVSIHSHSVVLLIVYCLFAFYFVLLTVGAAFTLYAVRPQFRIPTTWARTKTEPGSFLFFKEILNVSGKNWGRSFTETDSKKLKAEYAKNSVLETYLIAQKIPKKLRPLKKGIWLFFASTAVLIVLLPLCAVTVVYVDVPTQNSIPVGTGSAEGKIDIPAAKTPPPTSQVQAEPTSAKSENGARTAKTVGDKHSQSANTDGRQDSEKH
jgi:hypothetical protein